MDARVGRRALAALPIALLGSLLAVAPAADQPASTRQPEAVYPLRGWPLHRTHYVQQRAGARRSLEIMGDKVGRSPVCATPLQQTWWDGRSGDYAPTYYLHSDAPLYYYS